jgi:hypothetical protein
MCAVAQWGTWAKRCDDGNEKGEGRSRRWGMTTSATKMGADRDQLELYIETSKLK